MTSYLLTVLGQLVPVFSLIAVGYAARRCGFPGDGFWPQLERLVYFLLFPALLVDKLAQADVGGARFLLVGAAVALALTAMAAVMLALRRAFPLDGPGYTSVFQGGIRFNTYLGIAAALGIYGTRGGAVAAMVAAAMIPIVNVFCVAVLTRFAAAHASTLAVLRGIVRNPLILACATGIALNASGIGLPLGSAGIVEILGRAALPLGLMTVGAGLQLRTAWGHGWVLAATSALKLLLMPLIAFGAARLVGLPRLETHVLVLFGALPTATSAYILARQLGGDHTLIATILTVETVASAVTLPLTLLLLTLH
ncbi:MAG TPA: AEC family transporter [Gammaproteobacteria bacterium]|nr:AEC family transporter [Gammaproteobacteria bacterium]